MTFHHIINPTSLAKNNAKQLLAADICSNNAGIVAVTETWFKSHHDTSYSDISGYNCFRVDRSKRRGGGVCIYVQSRLKGTLRRTLTCIFFSFNKKFNI